MIPFELAEPTSLGAAVKLLDPDDETVRPIAGGTALMLMMKAGVFQPTCLVSLGKIEEKYSKISVGSSGELRIGALVPLSALEYSDEVRNAFPVIARTMRTLSNIRVRNVARVGGALAHGDPHMDLPPVLSALGAIAIVTGQKGEREIAVEDLYLGYYETVLEPGELITEVIVPPQKARRAAYLKFTTRTADDWPALGIAVSLEGDAGAVRNSSIVVSAATEKVTRLRGAQKEIDGGGASEAVLRRAGEAAVAESILVPDARGSMSYKQELLRVCVGRAVQMALRDGGAT
jgi:aerobic carbon-monoxide dehydrogenase medium subunit